MVDVAIEVKLQQIGRVVRRLSDSRAAVSVPETELGKVEGANEAVDRPNRIGRTDIVLDPGRKQTGLLAALAALERAIRHGTNRTRSSRKCSPFLPSLDGLFFDSAV